VRLIVLMLILAPAILVLDLVWLGLIMRDFYSRELGDLARRSGEAFAPRWGPAIGAYVLIPAGLVLFDRPLLAEQAPLWQAFGWGAAFGLVLYGVYDLTNLAILEKWTLRVTLADMAWGMVLCGTSALVMRLADGWLPK
jgi:uncharacterized membrane protein